MSERVHIVVDERERDAFRARATEEGMSLSEWLRSAARDRLRSGRQPAISSLADLDRFFVERTRAEVGSEPDWEQHLAVIEQSRRGSTEPA